MKTISKLKANLLVTKKSASLFIQKMKTFKILLPFL